MRLLLLTFLAVCIPLFSHAQVSSTKLFALQDLFDPSRDLLDVKLTVDEAVAPSVDAVAIKSTVEQMASDIAIMAGEGADATSRLAALKRYLYESGAWNDDKPFQYDLEDPLGTNPANRLLQHYLTTRRGNCVTMPLLFLVLGQRLGLNMALAEAPLHVFIKYTDDDGRVWNLEPTSGGGFTRDVWYRKQLPMSDQAVANGVYMRALSDQEEAALVASFLVEDQISEGRFEAAIATTEALLQHYPNFAYGLVLQGNAYAGLLRREVSNKYATIEDIPSELRHQADVWYKRNIEAFAKAEALGWRSMDGEGN